MTGLDPFGREFWTRDKNPPHELKPDSALFYSKHLFIHDFSDSTYGVSLRSDGRRAIGPLVKIEVARKAMRRLEAAYVKRGCPEPPPIGRERDQSFQQSDAWISFKLDAQKIIRIATAEDERP